MCARVPDSSMALPAPWAMVGAPGRHRPATGARRRDRPVAASEGRRVAASEGRPAPGSEGRHRAGAGGRPPSGAGNGHPLGVGIRHLSGADGRHRARVTDRLPVGSRRVMAAVVAIAAVGGGGLLLDPQARTVAQPEQPIPDPAVTPASPAAQALTAQALTAQPPAAESQSQPVPFQALPAPVSPARIPAPRSPEEASDRAPSSTRTPDRSPASDRSSATAARPPAGNPAEPSSINLAGWRLTLPTKGDKGGAALVDPLNKVGPWLNRTAGGAFTFWAPTDGATTKNSQHARTELVSRQNFTAGQDARTLRAAVTVSQTPSSGDIILGQIHGAGDMKSVPYVMLHYKGGTIEVVVKKGRSGDAADRYTLLTGVPIGARFGFTIADAGDGTMVFTASRGAQNRRVSAAVPQSFRGATVRFQAGAYQLGEGGGSDEGGRVTFHGLTEK